MKRRCCILRRVGGEHPLLSVGLLAYDAFWVFGSGYVFGDGSMDGNVMMTVVRGW